MKDRSSRRTRRTSLRVGAPRAAVALALLALAGSIAGANLAHAAGPGLVAQTVDPEPFERLCSDPLPGYVACFAERRTEAGQPNQVQAAAAVSGYGPADIQSAYTLSSSLGAGRTVAIVDAYDLPTAESDLATYRSQFGLPPCTTANGCFRKINQTGGTTPPAANDGWGAEIALDIDMVSAACPQCKILLVEASSPTIANLGTAVNQAVAQGAVAISNSYGGSDSSSAPSWDNAYYKHAGVAITASSGDNGYGTSYPASSPWVTAVGGTSLTRATNARGWTETVWSGAGSGCSSYEAKPSWQHDTGCARRTIADVSAVADPATGVAVYDSYGTGGGWRVYGGTSASSPIIASVFAMATPAPAGIYPSQYPYGGSGSLFDVTSGSNGNCSPAYLCKGGVGYDGPTGLGTPNGVAAFGPGTAPPANDFSLAVSPTAATVTAGNGTTATVSTATTSGSAQSVALSTSGLPAGATASFSPSTVTSGGSSTLTISTSASTPAGTYPVTITGTGSSATHTTTFSLTVNGTSTCASGQKLANPGFESGSASWSATSGVIGQWGSQGQPTHGGSWDAWLDGYGRSHTDTLSQSVTIPAGCSQYTLSFWLHIDSSETTSLQANDTLTVRLGSTTLATYSNLNKASGYALRSFNVAAFAGQTVTLTFTGTENSLRQTSFVLDDLALNAS